MKKLFLFSFLVILSMTGFCQSYIFNSYGLELPDYSSGIEFTAGKLSFETIDIGLYRVIAYDKNDKIQAFIGVKQQEKQNDEYFYVGLIEINGSKKPCFIYSKTSFDNFLKGNGNKYKDYFKSDYAVRIMYGASLDELTNRINFYPIMNDLNETLREK